MRFVVYSYIMDLITTFVSVKQARLHVNSAYVNVFVMWLCVCNRIQVQLEVSMNVSCFPQNAGPWGTVKTQIVHWLIVILCALCGAVHRLQQHKVGINSMDDVK
jgi:hypothetical protein